MTIQTAVNAIETHNSVIAEELAPYETIEVSPAGRVLFQEGTEANGVYFLHSGEADLYFSSPRSGEAKSLLIAESGQILGLTAVMSNHAHDCTATTRTPCITGFIEKNRFLRLLDEQPGLWLGVLRMISTNISACWECMRSLSGVR